MGVWTTPRTWSTGELVTAAIMNQHVRDELLQLGGADGVSTSPPGSPTRYQRWCYPTGGAYGQHWTFIYRDDVNGTYPWVCCGAVPLVSNASGSFGSGTYSSNVGTGASITVPRTGYYRVIWAGDGATSGGGFTLIAFAAGGSIDTSRMSGNNSLTFVYDAPILMTGGNAVDVRGGCGNGGGFDASVTVFPLMVQ